MNEENKSCQQFLVDELKELDRVFNQMKEIAIAEDNMELAREISNDLNYVNGAILHTLEIYNEHNKENE